MTLNSWTVKTSQTGPDGKNASAARETVPWTHFRARCIGTSTLRSLDYKATC
jgi:hypothetical protein